MARPGHDPLLGDLAAGRAEAFAALYDRFGGRLYRVAWGMLGRSEDAEDAVQEVFLGLVRSRHKLQEVRDLTAYLFAALRRAAGRVAIQRAREPTPSDEAARQVEAGVAAEAASNPWSERLERALRALPSEQREVIVMKIDAELTFAQIADVLGISVNTAASRYRYAMEKLRGSLGVKP